MVLQLAPQLNQTLGKLCRSFHFTAPRRGFTGDSFVLAMLPRGLRAARRCPQPLAQHPGFFSPPRPLPGWDFPVTKPAGSGTEQAGLQEAARTSPCVRAGRGGRRNKSTRVSGRDPFGILPPSGAGPRAPGDVGTAGHPSSSSWGAELGREARTRIHPL